MLPDGKILFGVSEEYEKTLFKVVLTNLRPWSDYEFDQKTTCGPLILKFKF